MSDDPNSGPAPEELKPESDGSSGEAGGGGDSAAIEAVKAAARKRRGAYKPSHKGTFIGLAVVAIILILNAFGLMFILHGQDDSAKKAQESVTLSSSSLNKLGVSRNSVGSQGVQLTINPDTDFGGKVTIAGDTQVSGNLKLNNAFTAPTGSFGKLQGGDTSVDKIDINGDATASNLNLRKDLQVAGNTRFQGQATFSQLMVVNNNVNITGSLSVGGTFAVKQLQLGGLSLAGHFISGGSTPLILPGGAVGSNGTVSNGGNDTSGTINVNIGVGATAGTLVSIFFITKYTDTPHVVVTSVGRSAPGFYINRNTSGFSIVTPSGLSPGGYAFDYVVMQ